MRLDHVSDFAIDGITFEKSRTTALEIRNSVLVKVVASTFRRTGSWAVRIDGGRDGRVCRVKRLCTARESQAFSAVGMAGGECLQCHVMDGSTIFRSENHRRMKPLSRVTSASAHSSACAPMRKSGTMASRKASFFRAASSRAFFQISPARIVAASGIGEKSMSESAGTPQNARFSSSWR